MIAIDHNDAVETTATQNTDEKPVRKEPGGLKLFLRSVMAEMKKTNWPSRDELTKFTVVVLVTIFAVAVFLYVSDAVVARLMDLVLGTQAATGVK